MGQGEGEPDTCTNIEVSSAVLHPRFDQSVSPVSRF
jgi:hypothetical protein